MKFAKENIQCEMDVSVLIKAYASGKKQQMSSSDLDLLVLQDTQVADLVEFEKMYGTYLIVGFEYGGEILFQSTHSAETYEDKMAIEAGLRYEISQALNNAILFLCTNVHRSSVSRTMLSDFLSTQIRKWGSQRTTYRRASIERWK